jgi:hypothetical protein
LPVSHSSRQARSILPLLHQKNSTAQHPSYLGHIRILVNVLPAYLSKTLLYLQNVGPGTATVEAPCQLSLPRTPALFSLVSAAAALRIGGCMLSMSSVKGHRNPAVEYYVCGRYSTAACKDAIWEGQGFELQANVRVQKAFVRRPQGHIWTTIHPQVLLLLILSYKY